MKLILPIVLLLVGLGIGGGAGLYLQPAPPPEDKAEPKEADENAAPPEQENEGAREFVRLNNQFVVPVVVDDRIASLVVLSFSLEVIAGTQEQIFSTEPKVRDTFLQVLFDHANTGGFDGVFTRTSNMEHIRRSLLEAAQGLFGGAVTDVLIIDVARQDNS